MQTTDLCAWCHGTGTYNGPMLNQHYIGPCIMCDTPEEDDDDYTC